MDPVVHESESPYAGMGNNPVLNVDPFGDKQVKSIDNVPAFETDAAICEAQRYIPGIDPPLAEPKTDNSVIRQTPTNTASEIKSGIDNDPNILTRTIGQLGYGILDDIQIAGSNLINKLGLSDQQATNLQGEIVDPQDVTNASMNMLPYAIAWEAKAINGLKVMPKEGTSLSRALGVEGEQGAGISGQKKAYYTKSRKKIIPDQVTEKAVIEVKNVNYQSLTKQLNNYIEYSNENKLVLELYTRPWTKISKPLQSAIDKGQIIHKYIPGM